MTRLVMTSRVDGDGVLRLVVPIGKADADREVRLTIESEAPAPMSQEEWHKFVLATAGSITDPSFVRHPQGEYEQREALP